MSTKANKPVKYRLRIILFLSPMLANAGCQHIGPQSIVDDRLAYNNAIVTSWEQQALLNIVRARYDDFVGFVNVDSMAQTHTLQGSVSATLGAILTPWNLATNMINPSGMGSRTATDSPLISYTPATGADFAKSITAPIKPADILNLIESNYNTYALLNLTFY